MTSLHASGVQIKQMENNSPAVCLVEPEAHASFRLAGCRHAASAGGKTFRAIGKRTSFGRSDLSRLPNQRPAVRTLAGSPTSRFAPPPPRAPIPVVGSCIFLLLNSIRFCDLLWDWFTVISINRHIILFDQ
jgi:hypothetical protein